MPDQLRLEAQCFVLPDMEKLITWPDAAQLNAIMSQWSSIKQNPRGIAHAVNVEDSMNQRKTVCYEAGKLPAWIMEQLAMGIMGVFFPVNFMKEDGRMTAVFQTDGYKPLSHIHSLSTEEVFQMFCQLMTEMENNEKHYLFPDRYLIHGETVYYNPLKNRMRMIFLPNEEGVSGREQLCRLALSCKNIISEEGHGYLDSWAEELQKADLSYRSAIHRCELLMQEIYVCDIP